MTARRSSVSGREVWGEVGCPRQPEPVPMSVPRVEPDSALRRKTPTRPLGFPDRAAARAVRLRSSARSARSRSARARCRSTQWGASRAVEMVGQDPSYVGLLAQAAEDRRLRRAGADHRARAAAARRLLAQALYLLGPRRGRPYVAGELPAVPGRQPHGQRAVRPPQGQLHRRASPTARGASRRATAASSSSTRSPTCT